MDPAGLLDGDSCGYPVTGGYYDVKSDLGSLPRRERPAVRDRVMARLVQEWADDYVLTGRARLDRPWQHVRGGQSGSVYRCGEPRSGRIAPWLQ